MKRKLLFTPLIITTLLSLSSCAHKKVQKSLLDYETSYHLQLPTTYDVLLYKSTTSIDSFSTYIALKLNEPYTLIYEEQFTSDYAKYQDFNVLDKIQLAKRIFQNLIYEKEEKYFVVTLTTYDWYAYEYTSISGQYNVVRYVDFYVIHDQDANNMYLFYDRHQYPYNDQAGLS